MKKAIGSINHVKNLFILSIFTVFPSVLTFASDTPPNIVFIIADDLGPNDTSFMGNQEVRTPALEELAAKSTVLEQVYVTSPSCAPSRGSLLSGLMPYRNGAEPNHTYVRDDVKQLPVYMKELGYETVCIGKITHGKDARAGFDHDDKQISLESIGKVADFLKNRKSDKPLLLMIGVRDPHVPWPEEYFPHYDPDTLDLPNQLVDTPDTRLEFAQYYTDVEIMDKQIGATLDAVEKHLDGETIIFFTSDHGAQLPYGKWNNYDYSLQAPMLVSWPGTVTVGERHSTLISFVDILPTMIEIAGGEAPKSGYGEGEIDGRSFLPLLKGKTDHHRNYVFGTNSSAAHHTYPTRSVRTDRFRYILNVFPELNFTVQTDHNPKAESHNLWVSWVEAAKTDPLVAHKIKAYHQRPKEELYDLQRDPYEQFNLANDPVYSEKLHEMRKLLQNWIEKSGDTLEMHGKPMQVLLPVE